MLRRKLPYVLACLIGVSIYPMFVLYSNISPVSRLRVPKFAIRENFKSTKTFLPANPLPTDYVTNKPNIDSQSTPSKPIVDSQSKTSKPIVDSQSKTRKSITDSQSTPSKSIAVSQSKPSKSIAISQSKPGNTLVDSPKINEQGQLIHRIALSRNVTPEIVKNILKTVIQTNRTSPAYHCFNINSPSKSAGLMVDLNLYKENLPDSTTKIGQLGDDMTQKVAPASINFYLEIPPQKMATTAFYAKSHYDRNDSIWLMVNHEWIFDHYLKNITIGILVAKTKIAVQLLQEYRSRKRLNYAILYTGHSSNDKFQEEPEEKWNEFLHLGGGSWMKHTEPIFNAWLKFPEWPKITIRHRYPEVCKKFLKQKGNRAALNIDMKCGDVSSSEVNKLQNKIKIHLCPSRIEGFGHYINEAMSTGSLVITSNAAPMNELVSNTSGLLIGIENKDRIGSFRVPSARIDISHIEIGVKKVLNMSIERRKQFGKNSRAKFLERKNHFEHEMNAIHKAFCSKTVQLRHIEQMIF